VPRNARWSGKTDAEKEKKGGKKTDRKMTEGINLKMRLEKTDKDLNEGFKKQKE